MIRLAIAEDHQSVIDGISLLLKYEENIEIVGTAKDGEELVKLVRLKQPQVVITDIRMPKMDGIEATKIIKKEFPHTKVLAFTMLDQPDITHQMQQAGVSGYLLKNSPLEDILKAVNTVHQGQTYYDSNIILSDKKDANKKSKGILTKRQMEILYLVGQGKTSRQIADQLFISVHAVDTHRKNMVRRLGLKGKNALYRYANERRY